MAKILMCLFMIIWISAEDHDRLFATNNELRAVTIAQFHEVPKEPQSNTKKGNAITIDLALMDARHMLGRVNEEYEKLEKELKELLEKLKTMEKEAEEKIREEILPQLKREMEKLKKWLRELQFDEHQSEPQKTMVELKSWPVEDPLFYSSIKPQYG